MVSVCLPSDDLLQYLLSYLGFSYLGRGVGPPRRRPWPQAWGLGYLLHAAAPDLRRGVTPLIALRLKSMPQPVTLKKLKLNGSVKTYKTF